MDADLSDWCIGAFSNTFPGGGRTEDSSAQLSCGRCSVTVDQACQVNADCPGGETCSDLGSKTELVWWDNRTDGAVNDLATVATAQDNTNLYFAAELWVDPDPRSLPFAEIGIDYKSGGIDTWFDPMGNLTNPGQCSVSTDRACTTDNDCHFCTVSTEPDPSTRLRTCGSGCDPDNPEDVCDDSQTCIGAGSQGLIQGVGLNASPTTLPDHLLVFDFSIWLSPVDEAVMLMTDVGGEWAPGPQFEPFVNPGASGGSGGPPGSVEVAIPWSAFGCTGCPDACNCPGLGPGQDFRFTIVVARGINDVNYTPDGPIEDVMSEPVAGATTTTTDSCPGFGIGNTTCEIADGSIDSFVPPVAGAGGRVDGLRVSKNAAPSITLTWNRSSCPDDADFGIYEGEIGVWYSHQQLPAGSCTTGGATTATFDASDGNRYYIVAPTDGANEGSYGLSFVNQSEQERPPSTTPCHTQALGASCLP